MNKQSREKTNKVIKSKLLNFANSNDSIKALLTDEKKMNELINIIDAYTNENCGNSGATCCNRLE